MGSLGSHCPCTGHCLWWVDGRGLQKCPARLESPHPQKTTASLLLFSLSSQPPDLLRRQPRGAPWSPDSEELKFMVTLLSGGQGGVGGNQTKRKWRKKILWVGTNFADSPSGPYFLLAHKILTNVFIKHLMNIVHQMNNDLLLCSNHNTVIYVLNTQPSIPESTFHPRKRAGPFTLPVLRLQCRFSTCVSLLFFVFGKEKAREGT